MGINKGYLKADRSAISDEQFTPRYAILPLLKYLKPNSTIWCPFDKADSAFVKVFKEYGHNVINTCLEIHEDGTEYGNFFEVSGDYSMFENEDIDYIISNPPYSIKDKVLEQLYELDIPFAMLLPLPTLQGITRYEYFKNGIQLLSFDKRINYIKNGKLQKGNSFASAYFCYNLLPKDLILERLEEHNE